jgi:hypothetical protein
MGVKGASFFYKNLINHYLKIYQPFREPFQHPSLKVVGVTFFI